VRKTIPAANPQAYVAALSGWQAALVKKLRAAVRRTKPAEEAVKWGHLVYFASGPVALIRAEEARVLFGFWRGKRLIELEPRLKPGGKYEMATIAFKQGDPVSPAKATQLMRAAIALNETVGDPTAAAKVPKRRGRARG
jgi:hypothetical protein